MKKEWPWYIPRLKKRPWPWNLVIPLLIIAIFLYLCIMVALFGELGLS